MNPSANDNIGATKVTLTEDTTGVLACGVEFIRFTANRVNGLQNDGAFVFRELAVFGVPSNDETPPMISSLSPADATMGVSPSGNLVATFSESIALGTGTITIKNLDAPALTVITLPDARVSVSGAVLTINPPLDLRPLGQDGHRGYGGQNASGLQGNIVSWLNSDNPDIVLLKIGTNGQDTTTLQTLVNTIVTTKPAAHLIIAQIMPKYSYEAGIVNYNTYIRNTLVPAQQALGRKVTLVDQYAPFLTNPATGTSVNPITQQLDKATGVFKYTRTKDSGLSYKIYYSTSLSAWTLDAAATQSPAAAVAGIETVTVTLAAAAPVNGKLFVRVEASPAP